LVAGVGLEPTTFGL